MLLGSWARQKFEADPTISTALGSVGFLIRFGVWATFFMVFGDSALNFETVYYVVVPDYQTYAETRHAINLEIFRRFAEEDIEFAYPTQTVYLEGAKPGE